MRRIPIKGLQTPSTGLPVEAIVAELCSTKTATNKLIFLMKDVLEELKGLRKDIREALEKSDRGIEKADQVISKMEKVIEKEL